MWVSWFSEVYKVEGNEPVDLKNLGVHQPPLPAGRRMGHLSLCRENGQPLLLIERARPNDSGGFSDSQIP